MDIHLFLMSFGVLLVFLPALDTTPGWRMRIFRCLMAFAGLIFIVQTVVVLVVRIPKGMLPI